MFNPKRVPVPGLSLHRWRSSYWYRSVHTSAEHRMNQPIAGDEPSCRAARGDRLLPTSWDDWPRCVQRCWKTQHRGRKAWQR
jgi:hypothetical protein